MVLSFGDRASGPPTLFSACAGYLLQRLTRSLEDCTQRAGLPLGSLFSGTSGSLATALSQPLPIYGIALNDACRDLRTMCFAPNYDRILHCVGDGDRAHYRVA